MNLQSLQQFLVATVLLVASTSAIDDKSFTSKTDLNLNDDFGSTPTSLLPESAALKAAEPLPTAEAHISTRLFTDNTGNEAGHSGGPKVRKAAQTSQTREMTASSTASPSSTLHVNDNSNRDNRGTRLFTTKCLYNTSPYLASLQCVRLDIFRKKKQSH